MSDIVEELLTQLDEANAQLKQKEELIEKLRADSAGDSEASSKLFRGIAKALKINNRTVLQTATTDSVRIEFPKIVKPEMPTFETQPSVRTQFREELRALQPSLKQRAEVQEEFNKRMQALDEEYNKKKKELTDSFEAVKTQIDIEVKTFLGTLGANITGSLLAETFSLAVYSIERIDADNQQLVLKKLTDSNGIVLLGEKTESRDINGLENVYCLSTAEAHLFYESLSSDQHTIQIQYQLIDIGEEEKACCPYHFQPDLNMEDYEINFAKASNTITKVTNKKDGEVRFSAVQVDTECGFVMSSVVELFTAQAAEGVCNIVHAHVDDISEEIPIEAVYVLPEQDNSEYHDFAVDARGVALRYKVLVQEGKVRTVLYNPGGGIVNEIPYIERSFEVGSLVRYGEYIARVVTIPVGMLARSWEMRDAAVPTPIVRESPISFCSHRHIEDMPGVIEIELIHNGKKVLQGKTVVAVPICEVTPASSEDRRVLESVKEEEEKLRLVTIERSAAELTTILNQLRSGEKLNPQETLERLREASSALRVAVHSEAANYSGLLQQCDRALRALAIEIRTQGS